MYVVIQHFERTKVWVSVQGQILSRSFLRRQRFRKWNHDWVHLSHDYVPKFERWDLSNTILRLLKSGIRERTAWWKRIGQHKKEEEKGIEVEK
jgi:hypothetical protein